MTETAPAPADEAAITFERRLNLWLGKFVSSPASAKAYADDLGMPHEARDFYAATPPDTPQRRGRKRGVLRRGVAFLPWCAAHGLDPLTDVGLEQIQQWLAATQDAGLAKSTRAKMLAVVREFYTAMQRQGVRVGNPAKLVDTRTAGLTGSSDDDDQLYLDVAQTRQLIIAARRAPTARRDARYRERDLAILLVLAVTGARASEVTGLDVTDLRRPNPNSGVTLRFRGKGDKYRTAEVDKHVADDIQAWLRARSEMLDRRAPVPAGHRSPGRQPLFCTRTGARLSPGYLGDIMQRVARDSPLAGIAHELHPHALRAAFITAALDAGIPIDQVASAVGHAHISTTMRYDRRRHRRHSGAFRAVSGLIVTETRAEAAEPSDPHETIATALAGYDAQQIDGNGRPHPRFR